MPLDDEQVRHIARLARIAVSDSEVSAVRDDLNRIFTLIERMQAVDTNGVAPMSHAQDVVARLRDDIASERVDRDRFQAIAPQVEDGLYLVPKVIE